MRELGPVTAQRCHPWLPSQASRQDAASHAWGPAVRWESWLTASLPLPPPGPGTPGTCLRARVSARSVNAVTQGPVLSITPSSDSGDLEFWGLPSHGPCHHPLLQAASSRGLAASCEGAQSLSLGCEKSPLAGLLARSP